MVDSTGSGVATELHFRLERRIVARVPTTGEGKARCSTLVLSDCHLVSSGPTPVHSPHRAARHVAAVSVSLNKTLTPGAPSLREIKGTMSRAHRTYHAHCRHQASQCLGLTDLRKTGCCTFSESQFHRRHSQKVYHVKRLKS